MGLPALQGSSIDAGNATSQAQTCSVLVCGVDVQAKLQRPSRAIIRPLPSGRSPILFLRAPAVPQSRPMRGL